MPTLDATTLTTQLEPVTSKCHTKLTDVKPSLPLANQSTSWFILLPAEIRLMVLRELLLCSEPIAERKNYTAALSRSPIERSTRQPLPRAAKNDQRPGSKPKEPECKTYVGYKIAPAILQACQNTLYEGLPILYGENTIQVQLVVDGYSFDGWQLRGVSMYSYAWPQ